MPAPPALSTEMLAAFVRVAEHGSVTLAAASLGVGKSVVSKRIAQLEAAVKSTLFSRQTRRIAPTAAGEAYLEFARRALAEVAAAEERLRDLRDELSGNLRLTASVSWGQRVLAPCLPAFLLRHPGVSVELLLGDRLMDIAHERIDLALRWTPSPSTEFACEPVAQVRWALVAAPAYLAAAGRPRTPAALAEHPCMGYWRDSADSTWTLHAGARRQQVRVASRYHANLPEAVEQAALAGLGIALLPGYVCDEAVAEGRLEQVLPNWTPEPRFGARVFAVAAPERLRLTRNRALLDFLRQRLGAGATPLSG
jgi:DNA-binding transcriptional LysR family regulator